jgi:hypothetical protein
MHAAASATLGARCWSNTYIAKEAGSGKKNAKFHFTCESSKKLKASITKSSGDSFGVPI